MFILFFLQLNYKMCLFLSKWEGGEESKTGLRKQSVCRAVSMDTTVEPVQLLKTDWPLNTAPIGCEGQASLPLHQSVIVCGCPRKEA